MISIVEKLFNECILIEEITIPSSVTSIKTNAFDGCKSLKRISFNENSKIQKFIDYQFSRIETLEEIIIPSSVVSN